MSKKGYNILKTCIFLLSVAVLLMGKAFGVPEDDYKEIHDPVMNSLLDKINNKVNNDETVAKALQISSSICMDLSFLFMFGYWVVKINTGRLLYSMASFYVIRNII